MTLKPQAIRGDDFAFWLAGTSTDLSVRLPILCMGASMSAEILAAAETMNEAGRWQLMLSLGRRAVTDAAVRADVTALAASPGFYPRRLALMAGCGSGDRDIILAALTDASAALANLAVKAAAFPRRRDPRPTIGGPACLTPAPPGASLRRDTA